MSFISSTSTLLPHVPTESMEEHPPIFLKLNEAALELLATSINADEKPNVTLSLSDRAAALKINNYEFQGSHYREPGSVQIFTPEGESLSQLPRSVFRNMGLVQSRVNLKQDKPHKIPNSPKEVIDLAKPTESKIINLLAIKPYTASELIAKVQTPFSVVQAVLNQVANPVSDGSDQFTLRPEILATLPKRETTPPKRSARNLSSRPSTPPESISSSSNGALNGHTKQPEPDHRRSAKREEVGEAPPAVKKSSLKRKMTHDTTTDSPKKVKGGSTYEDMFELARKFREVYSEYLDLYGKLSNPKSRPPSQVQRLIAMHKQLGQWKQTLWSNARSKQVK